MEQAPVERVALATGIACGSPRRGYLELSPTRTKKIWREGASRAFGAMGNFTVGQAGTLDQHHEADPPRLAF